MTANDLAKLSERRRNFRRNIRRYAYTQSYARLAGRQNEAGYPRRHFQRGRIIFWLSGAAFFGLGLYFMIF